jgi:hypothetical protein
MSWWKRKKAGPDASDQRRQIQEARDRLVQVEADIRRQAVEQEIDQACGERPGTS